MTSRQPGAVRACYIIIKTFSDDSNHRLSFNLPIVWRFIRSFIDNVTGMLSVDLLRPYNSCLQRGSLLPAGIASLFYIYFFNNSLQYSNISPIVKLAHGSALMWPTIRRTCLSPDSFRPFDWWSPSARASRRRCRPPSSSRFCNGLSNWSAGSTCAWRDPVTVTRGDHRRGQSIGRCGGWDFEFYHHAKDAPRGGHKVVYFVAARGKN